MDNQSSISLEELLQKKEIASWQVVPDGAKPDPNEVVVEPPKRLKLILLIGQSNMAGRAKPDEDDLILPLTGAYKFNRDCKWVEATSPLHFDRDFAGVGPAEEFVRRYRYDHPDDIIGIVPCAVGGSCFLTWAAHGEGVIGQNLRNAVKRAKEAMKYGDFIAVLWHQGEADGQSFPLEILNGYYSREFALMVGKVREELGNDRLPFVVGEIGRFWLETAEKLNPIINSFAEDINDCVVASSSGLEHFDNLHFAFKSANEFGRRYYEAFAKYQNALIGETEPKLYGDGIHDDTDAIQAMLDSGLSSVYLPPTQKHYLISRSLVISSRQELRLDRFTRIKLAPYSNQPMVVNREWESGNVDIAITGGIWDYDNRYQGMNGAFVSDRHKDGSIRPKHFERNYHLGCIFRFEKVSRLHVNGVTFKNPTTYSCQLTKVDHFSVSDITFDFDTWNPKPLNMDGIHLDGGCHHGKITNLRGTAFDDMVALNANDGICSNFEGPIHDIDIDGLYADYTHRGVRILSTDPSSFVKRVTIRNIHIATYRNLVAITHFYPDRPGRGYFDSITVRDCSGTCAPEPGDLHKSNFAWPLIWVQEGSDVGQLIVDNVYREEVYRSDVPTIGIEKGVTIDKLIIRDCRQVNCVDGRITFFDNKGDIRELEINGTTQSQISVLRRIGQIRHRNASEIASSNWTLGCEVLDRDFADFEQYKSYINPLGIKTIRLQGGWAKCEKVKGVYDFAWLDKIVDYAIGEGLNVLLETDYGNPIYEGGGGFDLAGGFPTSEEALAAWDKWVDAFSEHFKGRVTDWAMWNEPDIGTPKKTPEDIAKINTRTAKIIRKNIPESRLAGLSLAYNSPEFFESCLKAMGDDVMLFDWFIYHGYADAPEASYQNVEALKAILATYNPKAKMRQGENGCPSEMATRFALGGVPWSEYSQAKWDMRRMLGDLGHDVESSVFTICDFNHQGREINLKGLLRADEEKKVIAVKRAYYAVQNVVSIFDGTLSRVVDMHLSSTDLTLALYEYKNASGEPLYLFWSFAEKTHKTTDEERDTIPGAGRFIADPVRPGDRLDKRPAVLKVLDKPLSDPVWVDLLTGAIYEFPMENVIEGNGYTRYLDVPVYDSPCILTERSALPMC